MTTTLSFKISPPTGSLRSAVVADPYPIWEDLRQRCPVAHTIVTAGLVSRDPRRRLRDREGHDELHESQRRHRQCRPTELDLPAPIGVAPRSPRTRVPRDARRLILPAFAPGPINALEPMIRELCSKLLDTMAVRRRERGHPVRAVHPAERHPRHVGFPEEDIEQFSNSSTSSSRVSITGRRAHHRVRAGREVLRRPDRRAHGQPRDDLTSYLLNAELDGQNLALEHVFGTMVLILVAGIDTTWSAIGSAIWHLATTRGLARLVNEPISCPSQSKSSSASTLRSPWHDWSSMTWSTGLSDERGRLDSAGFPGGNRDPVAFKDATSSSSIERRIVTSL